MLYVFYGLICVISELAESMYRPLDEWRNLGAPTQNPPSPVMFSVWSLVKIVKFTSIVTNHN